MRIISIVMVLCVFGAGEALAADPKTSRRARAQAEELTLRVLDPATSPTAKAAAAKDRHARMRALAEDDPAEFLRLALPDHMRARLPKAVQTDVEYPDQLDGELEVLHEDYADGTGRYRYSIVADQSRTGRITPHRVRLTFPGEPRSDVLTGQRVQAHGVRIDDAKKGDVMAVTQPLNVVSPAPPAGTFGVQKTLMILVYFSNQAAPTTTADYVKSSSAAALNSFNVANSYGQTSVNTTVVGWYRIALSTAGCDYTTLATQAKAAAGKAGIAVSNYRRLIYAFSGNGCSWIGLGTVGGNPSQAWVKTLSLMAVAHEFGHNLGLYHAHNLDCGVNVVGTLNAGCTMSEYGDVWDMMGGGTNQTHHFNPYLKHRLGWLAYNVSPPINEISASGDYEIGPYEAQNTATKALRVFRGKDANGQPIYYYFSWRQAIPAAAGGLTVNLGTENVWTTSYLLDFTPETSAWTDSIIPLGKTYSDGGAATPITVTPTGITNAGMMLVSVRLGALPPPPPPPPDGDPPPTPVCALVKPTVVVTPSNQFLPGGTKATYTAFITNANPATATDGTVCPPVTYSVGRTYPTGWTVALSAWSTGFLASGETKPVDLWLTSPPGTVPNVYWLSVRVYGGGADFYTPASYTVVSALARPPLPPRLRRPQPGVIPEAPATPPPAPAAPTTPQGSR